MQTPMKIAVFRALQLGDLLCALPAIACIKRNYPNSDLTVIGLPHMQKLLARYSFIDHLIDFPGYKGLPEQNEPDAKTVADFTQSMRDKHFDIVLQLQGDGTIVNDFLKQWDAKRLIGFCPEHCQENKDWLHYPNSLHEVDSHLQLLKHIELDVNEQDRRLLFPLSELDWLSFSRLKYSAQLSNYAIIHVGNRSSQRRWPLINFVSLARFLHDAGLKIVLTGTESEKGLVDRMEKMLDIEWINLAGKTSLGQLGCIVDKAAILICNCTGISHIAAALETPSIVISLDGEPGRWGPTNKNIHYTLDGRFEIDLEKVKTIIRDLLKSKVDPQLADPIDLRK